MAAAVEDNTLGPPDSGHIFDWPAIQERADSKLEVRYYLGGDSRYVALLLGFGDFWFNGRYQYYKFDGNLLDRNELVTLCGPDEAEKLRREPGRKLKAFFPGQGGWVPLRCLREVQAKQQAGQQQEQACEQDGVDMPLQGAPQGGDSKAKGRATAEELAADERMNGGYSGCRELTVPKEWARDELRHCEYPLAMKLQVRLNGVLLPEQYDVKVSRDNRQDRASRRYRIALPGTLREVGELVQASRYISEWRRPLPHLIVISVSNASLSLPLGRPPEDAKPEEAAAWDDEAGAVLLAAEDARAQPSTRARTLQKAANGGSKGLPHGCASPTEVDEPVPGLRELLHAMWAEQQGLLEAQAEEAGVLQERQHKLLAEHAGKVAALQQEHQHQLTKLQSKQQADVLKAVQRHYADSSNQRSGHLIDQYRCELQLMNDKHGAQLGKLASKQEAELQALLEKQQGEARKLEERMSRLAAEQREALQAALGRHQDAVCARVERHQVALQDAWQRCLHIEEEDAALTLAALSSTRPLPPAAPAPAPAPAAAASPAAASQQEQPAGASPAEQQPQSAPASAQEPLDTELQPQSSPASAQEPLDTELPSTTQAYVLLAAHPASQLPAEPSTSAEQQLEPCQPTPSGGLPPSIPDHDLSVGRPQQSAAQEQPPSCPQPLQSDDRRPASPSDASAEPGPGFITQAAHHATRTVLVAAGHRTDLEWRGSSPACLPALEPPHPGTAAVALAQDKPCEARAIPPEDEPAGLSSGSGSGSAQKRPWAAAAAMNSLDQDSLQPPIKRPHKLMVKMVHA